MSSSDPSGVRSAAGDPARAVVGEVSSVAGRRSIPAASSGAVCARRRNMAPVGMLRMAPPTSQRDSMKVRVVTAEDHVLSDKLMLSMVCVLGLMDY
ncbi:hypothetical protein PLESTB_000625500 [Pleodorina starrii]|uniref:Uncharacterized protein n=1 Tax=Pleodorina starrii TaxID=330485 RepID=A0A9W6BHY5_9CHLO|nr:hypothetical protein PLESTB_000625500 [Pleodorina starrii]